jgi:hypothetical protein
VGSGAVVLFINDTGAGTGADNEVGVILKNEFCPTFLCPGIFVRLCLVFVPICFDIFLSCSRSCCILFIIFVSIIVWSVCVLYIQVI